MASIVHISYLPGSQQMLRWLHRCIGSAEQRGVYVDEQLEMEVVSPDIEVVVRVGGSDAALVAFFRTNGDDLDVLCGKDDTYSVDDVNTVLEQASIALHGARWVSISDVAAAESEAGDGKEGKPSQDDLPF